MFRHATDSTAHTRPLATNQTGSFPRSVLCGQVGHTPRTLTRRSLLGGRSPRSARQPEASDEPEKPRRDRLRPRTRKSPTAPRSRQIGFIGALAVLLMTLALSFDPSTNALRRAQVASENDHRATTGIQAADTDRLDRSMPAHAADLAVAEEP